MIKEAIDKILSIAETKTFDIEGEHYATDALVLIDKPRYRPQPVKVNGLDSAVKLLTREIARVDSPVFVQVHNSRSITAFTTYDDRMTRSTLLQVTCDVPEFREGWRGQQAAHIELRSRFVQNDGVEYLLGLLSRVSSEKSVNSEDNGVTQKVTVKQGISLAIAENIKPRVKLRPFRTFLEVEQPESEFLLRMDEENGVGLFEADGGMWVMQAKESIQTYLEQSMSDLVEAGKVVIMM